ncbi:DUF2642 domain-containing protein [Ectobacillus ponti]|uniref:DUF2642 domain-containing protein n=1 Tax=Ectobacillus ponti TaxID=2961894 RepID=A0AA42BRS0_9BACI|nr:DUF2642 domain-containing protein [Ectobacillus ponti]MCP8967648.1 DUF2642 domain-containing protein [Ectobacillus ponti]
MARFQQHITKMVHVQLSADKFIDGILIDEGTDLLVVYAKEGYFYIPFLHIHRVQFYSNLDQSVQEHDFPSLGSGAQEESVLSATASFHDTLQIAKGLPVEVLAAGNRPLQGCVTDVMDDYFILYAPLYKSIYIPLQHVKWVKPYKDGQLPYGLDQQSFAPKQSSDALSRSFQEQLNTFLGQIVIFDLGIHSYKVGKLIEVQNDQAVIVTASNETVYLNLHHVKAMHSPA